MTGTVATAPGKVILSGEYAVLDGAPAVCMAVDCRAKATVRYVDAACSRVSAPGYSAVQGRFRSEGASIEWLQGESEFRLVGMVLRTVGQAEEGPLSIELDTRAFYDATSGKKIGLGSSAALTVALVAALTKSTDVLDGAGRAHRRFQEGSGSGVDIAAGVTGGLIEYRMKGTEVRTLRWPDDLAYRLIWTGIPASTRSKLGQLQGANHRRSREALVKAATSMATAWRSDRAVFGELQAYTEVLRQFSDEHDLGIFDAGHDKLVTDATSAGLVYKPCGAGGGDVGILLGTSDEQLEDFVKGIGAAGCRPLSRVLDVKGVELELR